MMNVPGGVTAAKGFTAGGIHCGIKTNNKEKKDLAIIYSEVLCNAAAVYTKNAVKAAPIYVTMEHLKNGKARAVIANSGNANACAPHGDENARKMCSLASKYLNIPEDDIIVASTGVIGQTLNIGAIEKGIPELSKSLTTDGSGSAAAAIMTTDLVKKEISVMFELGGKQVYLGGIAKGSGMIHPNMGTMLAFLTTDASISPEMLQEAISEATRVTFNRVSVDGDTSTNDMAAILANGLSGSPIIDSKNGDYEVFLSALKYVCQVLAKRIAADGEGATKLVTCRVFGAPDEETAETISKSVVKSSLVKTAMFGSDANWGRVLCAMGYSGAEFSPSDVEVGFKSEAGEITVCKGGVGLPFDEELAKEILSEHDVSIEINLNAGKSEVSTWGCDLSYDYVKINGDYRT